MGRTYRGLRKEFGTRKSRDHKTRSKWNASNGTRLRTLAIDLAEFRMMEASGESLHRPPDASLKPNPVLALLASDKTPVQKPPAQKQNSPVKKKKSVVVAPINITQVMKKQDNPELWATDIGILQRRRDFAARQTSYLFRLVKSIEKLRDPSFAEAISRLTKRRKQWDTVIGTLGEHLRERVIK